MAKLFMIFTCIQATERYQDESGLREDSYAESTKSFADFHGAIRAMLGDCGFNVPPNTQGTLFEEEL